MLMANMKCTGSKGYYNQMSMQTTTKKEDLSIAKYFQKHLSNTKWKNVVIDQGKYKGLASRQKCNDREYHVQYNSDVDHRCVKMIFNSTQFLILPLCGPHTKNHGMQGLRNNYHLSLYPKLVQGICEVQHIT